MTHVDGVVIKNTMNNAGVEEGMRGFKRQMGVLNSEMKANMSSFGKAEKSAQKYQTRLTTLDKQMKVQKRMFEQSKNDLNNVKQAYEKANNSIKTHEQKLKSLTQSHKIYDDALRKSNQELKKSDSELKKAQARQALLSAEKAKAKVKLDELCKAEQNLKNSSKATTEQVKQASNATKRQREVQQKLIASHKEESANVKKLKNTYKELETENKKIKQSHAESNDEVKKSQREYDKLSKTIKDYPKNLANAEKAVNNEKTAMNNLQKSIDSTKDAFSKFNKEQMISNSGFTKIAENLDRTSQKYEQMAQKMKSAGRNMSLYVTTPIAGAIGYAGKLGVEFDDGMRKVQAVSGATGKDLDALKNKAREMGATTKFSATDSAEAMNYMAMAGWKTQDMIKGLPGIMNLAAASGEELGIVSDIVTDGLTAFGLQAKDSGHFADVLAAASANANTNVSMMGEGFKYAAPVAGALGYSIEDTSIAIGLMSNAGIKGEKAGTALRTMFTNLASPTKAMKEQMDALGISMTDSNGQMKPMRDVMDDMRGKFKTLSKDQQAAAAATIFGKEAMSGALAVINASETDYKKLSKAIDGSEGSAKKMSDTMEKGLGGSLRSLKSAAEELGLSVYDTIEPALSGMVRGLKTTVDFLNKMPQGAKVATVGIMGVAAAIGPVTLGMGLVAGAISKATKGFASMNRQMAINSTEAAINAKANGSLATSISKSGKHTKGSIGLFNMFGKTTGKASGKVGLLSEATKFLGFGLKNASKALKIFGGPIGWIVTGVTVLGGALTNAYKNVEWFRNGVNGLGNVLKVFGGGAINGVKKLGAKFSETGGIIKDKFFGEIKKEYKALDDDDLLKKAGNGFESFMKKVGTASEKATDTTKVLGKGVSKETKKSLENYVKYSEESSKILTEVKMNHGKISEEKANELINIEQKLNEDLIQKLNQRREAEINSVNEVYELSKDLKNKKAQITDEEYQSMLQKTEQGNQKRIQRAQELDQQMLNMKQEFLANDGKLDDEEIKKLTEKQNERDQLVTESLTNSEKEQQKILDRMDANNEAYSIQQASRNIKDAEKARQKRKDEIDEQYTDQKLAIQQNEDLTKEDKDKQLAVLDEWKKEEVQKADDKKKEVVGKVKDQNGEIETEMDLSNGKVYSNSEKWLNKTKQFLKEDWNSYWQDVGNQASSVVGWFGDQSREMWGAFKKGWNTAVEKGGNLWSKITGKLGESWENTKKWFSGKGRSLQSNFKNGWNSAWDKSKGIWHKVSKGASDTWDKVKESTKTKLEGAKGTAISKTKGIWKNTSKWFGKTYDSVKSNTKSLYEKARDKYHDTAKTAGAKSKSVSQSTGKWFGKAYGSVKTNVSNMWGKSKTSFGNIASEGWKKAESVYKGFKKWLGKTLQWIKNIGSDMGRAAGDLGKTVANKAIGGLNGMIGGVNKISKAITGKSELIKPIPKLSTGTFDGSKVATDKHGGVKYSTLAMVNDKGPGNGPSGRTQELIQRKDGSLYAPNGKNAIVHLESGEGVINARDTYNMQKQGIIPKRLSTGTGVQIPRFSKGKKKKDEKLTDMIADKVKDVAGGFKDKASDAAHGIKDKTGDLLESAGEKIKDGASWLGDKIGDVWDYVSHPGKLVNKVLDSMGISFGGGDNATVTLVKSAYKHLKESLVEQVKSWFDDFGGEGDAAWLFKHDIWQRFGKYNGLNFNNGQHYGMDFGMTPGTPVYAVKGGKARVFDDYGGGHAVEIKTGANEWNWYMHLSKQIAKTGEQIKAGQLIAKSGNTGAFTAGSGHLHFQLMQGSHPGNDTAKDPEQWLKSLSGGGQNKAASKWAPEIRKAAGRMGVTLRGNDLNNIISLIHHESGGNAGVTQGNIGDINNMLGTPAQGLLQYVPSTFKNYAVKGHTNIKSGYDQLLAFFNNKYWRTQFNPMGGWSPSGPRRYENGGIVTKHQLAEIGEKNRPEAVIPLHRSKRGRAIRLMEQAMTALGIDNSGTKVTVNQNNQVIEQLLKQLLKANDRNNKLVQTLVNILSSSKTNGMNSMSDVERVVSKLMGERLALENYNGGQV